MLLGPRGKPVFACLAAFLFLQVVLLYYCLDLQHNLRSKSMDIEGLHAKSFHKIQNKTYQRTEAKNKIKKLSPNVNPSHQTNHNILFWYAQYWFKSRHSAANIKQCLYTNCIYSFNHSLFKESQVVVFNRGARKQPARSPNQVWVFFTLEPPVHLNQIYKLSEWHNVFNWSWTYHPNADIFLPYGLLIKKKALPSRHYSNIFKKKKKFAAWAVSNCGASSKRDDYVNILKRYVDVDVYGRCGRMAPKNLESVINENYKFYLGFENSLCDYYVTEKAFYYFQLDVITVLRGKAKYHDYLPSGSYIDTTNFSSIAALAQFMNDLAENEEMYVSYLKLKDEFTVIRNKRILLDDALCNLCEKVNKLDQNRRTYGDIFKELGQCYNASDLK